jgi:hypothetical protein
MGIGVPGVQPEADGGLERMRKGKERKGPFSASTNPFLPGYANPAEIRAVIK